MCAKCPVAIRRYFPDCPDDKMGDFLMSATSFPFGDGETVERQLREHRAAGVRTWREACARADAEMSAAMGYPSRAWHRCRRGRTWIKPTAANPTAWARTHPGDTQVF